MTQAERGVQEGEQEVFSAYVFVCRHTSILETRSSTSFETVSHGHGTRVLV